jgi:hypothetical protein
MDIGIMIGNPMINNANDLPFKTSRFSTGKDFIIYNARPSTLIIARPIKAEIIKAPRNKNIARIPGYM